MPELLPDGAADPVADAEAAVRAYARWHIAPNRADEVRFRSHGGTVLILPTLRLTAVESVTVDGDEVTGYAWAENGVLYRRGGWPCGMVVVKFTHGYDVADIPDLYRVIRSLAARGGPSGSYVQVGQVRVATDASGAPLGGALSASDKAVLDAYRLPGRP